MVAVCNFIDKLFIFDGEMNVFMEFLGLFCSFWAMV
jgi:hypothetical protein